MRWYLPDRHPIFWFELRRRLLCRRPLTSWRMLLTTIVRAVISLALLALIIQMACYNFQHDAGEETLWLYIILQGGTLAVIGPGMAAWCIAEEREKETFESLLTLPIPSCALVLEKYTYLVTMSLFIFALFFPCTLQALLKYPLSWFLGYALSFAAVAFYLACGLLMGCLFRSSRLASVVALATAFVVTAALVIFIRLLANQLNNVIPVSMSAPTDLPDIRLLLLIPLLLLPYLTTLCLRAGIRAIDRMRGGTTAGDAGARVSLK